ncbi:MAG: hypothetical protein DWQ58_01635 [Microcystis aeruginosa TA09]|jgi:hypothetical protein|nr:hypothetical protein [Microcystis aeruginosa LG13-13]NCR04137.1 hypothetical protein [Microcystis aeruginosa LG13-03]NCR62261.1 hypothetical protein [Microcystis aeruginosa LG11-05]NCR70629.1 hypothetical protein [Microcystis aeruginosa LG13-12]REJ59220.1 MAG: hypothetical protein DWQ58_01635 [Microcystis aeruginosa TA09]
MNLPKMTIGSRIKYLILAGIIALFTIGFNSLYSVSQNSIASFPVAEVQTQYLNDWTPELEAEFQQRAKQVINHFANRESYGNLWGENEKKSYAMAMFDFLAGNRQKALDFLQQDDPQTREQAHTDYIDYYFSFTLKGQIRKYFLLGKYLDPVYRQRMYNAAKIWTETDPLQRPHPIHGTGQGTGNDWSITRRGLWVDSRNTDNLRAMRETSVYLMAEETGNEATRQLYKSKIKRYVSALYNIGMGEWDSEVYHGHTFAPYLNLYDFAQDTEVKQWAKMALDWLSMAASVKYYRGGWGSPVKRDYGGSNGVMRSDSARTFWLYFGDTPVPNNRPELDSLYLITSRYRPPLAVMELARKNFNKPVEILASKPLYENWKPGNNQSPGYWETQFIGPSYQMGSLAGTFPDGDVASFKLMAFNQQKGVDFFVANTGKNGVKPGKNPGDEIGQYRNLLIWLRPADQAFFWQLPKTAKVEKDDNIWFIQLEKTWLALRLINLSSPEIIEIPNSPYPDDHTYQALPTGNNYAGFALEVGEAATQGSYENFKSIFKQKSQVNLTQINQGSLLFKGSQGQSLQFTYNQINLLPMLIRNGQKHDWSKNFALYNSLSRDNSPVSLGWKKGKLTVKAGKYQFSNALILSSP